MILFWFIRLMWTLSSKYRSLWHLDIEIASLAAANLPADHVDGGEEGAVGRESATMTAAVGTSDNNYTYIY